MHLGPQERLAAQTDFVYLDGENVMDFVGRFESLESAFSEVCKQLCLENLVLPKVNNTEHKYFAEYYDDESRRLVRDLYRNDFRNFNYS